METLIFYLLLGGLVMLMMRRGGCGAHAHGGHGGHAPEERQDRPGGQSDHAEGTAAGEIALVPDIDPVCGMKLMPDQGYGKMHEGRALRFCSRHCLDAFEATPQRFTPAAQPESRPRRSAHGR